MTAADLTETRRQLARYHGCISRWCALTGNVPDATKSKDITEEELNRFRKFLDKLAAEQKPSNNSPLQPEASWKF